MYPTTKRFAQWTCVPKNTLDLKPNIFTLSTYFLLVFLHSMIIITLQISSNDPKY